MSKKLVYILNHYSNNSDQHFFHVINLLEAIADLGVEVALVIEKCETEPVVNSGNIKVYGIPITVSKWRRTISLFNILKNYIPRGIIKFLQESQRLKHLANYKMKLINLSQVTYIISSILLIGIVHMLWDFSLISICLIFAITNIIQQFMLLYFRKKNGKEF